MVKPSKKKSKNKPRKKKYTLKKTNLGRGDNISNLGDVMKYNLGDVMKYNLSKFLTPKELVKLTSTSKSLHKLRNEKQISKIIQSGKQKYLDNIINSILNNEKNEYIELDYSEIINGLTDVITDINLSISEFEDQVQVYDYKRDEERWVDRKLTNQEKKELNELRKTVNYFIELQAKITGNVKDVKIVRDTIIYMIEKDMFLDNLYQYRDKKFFSKKFYIIITDKDSKIEPLLYLFSNNKLENKLDI